MPHEQEKTAKPPRVMGDVDIAHFPTAARNDRWRVSIGGTIHFLTDAATAYRIQALAAPAEKHDTYEKVYARYRATAGEDAESMTEFIAWCDRHGPRLESLADTPDEHALKLRRRLLDAAVCQRLAYPLSSLFRTLVMVPLWIVCLATLGAFLLGPSSYVHHTYWVAILLALGGVFIHEMGHITACIRYGARQGGIGVGLYWIWPAFFADVRGSWSLPAHQRLRVSLGGIYFQSIYVAILAVVALTTGNTHAFAAVQITLLLMATTLNPVLKYDGYWILSDAMNVTNLHKRIGIHLRSLMVANSTARKSILWTRWTGVCLLFASTAVAYIAYVLFALGRAAVGLVGKIPITYEGIVSLDPAATAAGRLTTYAGGVSLALQVLLVFFALILLGGIALKATLKLATAQGARS